MDSYAGISPDNYYLVQAINSIGLGAAPSWTVDENGDPLANVGGLAGVPVSDARRRMVETTRRFEQNISQLQFDMTLTGTLDDMSWELYYNSGRRTGKYDDLGQFIGTNLANAMGPSDDKDDDGNPECYRRC